jgi:uncharacterized membrane protein YqhA
MPEKAPEGWENTGPGPVRRPSVVVGRMVASSRFFVLIATISLFLAFMAVMVSTIVVTVDAILKGVTGYYTQNEMIGKLIKQADYALLATVLYVLALGLYSLFVDDRIPMPRWLRIHDLGQLKELLAGVVVVAIAVIFLGWALTWDGASNDILALGVGSAAVIGGLALFLWQAARERQMQSAERVAGARAGDEAPAAGASAAEPEDEDHRGDPRPPFGEDD